jgi:predicted ArsR family transcriptional regulator
VDLLGDLGFSPEHRPTDSGGQIGLRHCPFLDLVETQARVVCPLHLGLMQGAATALGASVTVERLEPFAEPDLCLVHLGGAHRPKKGASGRAGRARS